MLEEKLSLEGKSVVITGGGTGLGREMTLAMARAGADLVIASRRPGPIQEVADMVCDLGRKGVAISTDVTDSAQVNALMESAISELGKVDVLFNNAGIVRGQGATPIWEISDE
ncbi:MAG: SDR family oxidoreductase [Dehalococcoidia bacterium]|nr:SDR family oxidoreductase [Dehalococcoidia bacterium]